MITVCKQFEFAYAHCLPNHEGLCKRLHGHSGSLEVEITDTPEFRRNYPENESNEGMIIDYSDLKRIVNENVISVLDHSYLNDIFPLDMRPTSENIVKWIVSRLTLIFGPSLVRIRIYESPSSWAEWKNDHV